MSFPWAAKANTRTFRKRDRALSATRFCRKSLGWFVFLALSGVASVLDTPVARAEPPRNALPQVATQFVTSGTAAITESSATALTVTQQSQKAILNWQSFNVGRDASVTFRQPDSSSAALNRIRQGSPSEIFGKLSANGQIYLINQNGIIFGNGAQVDTHSLIASTIDISNTKFLNGLTSAVNQGEAAFDSGTAGATGPIKVEAGAVLKTDEGGSIMVFAPEIENRGEISTPGGQAILAASKNKVYLANSDDPNLRGLLVEVETGGTVTNDKLGKIVAERGNVTLLGYAVNQNGIVRATTSVNLNGSIRLVARDKATVNISNGVGTLQANRTDTLTLGAGSLTEVVPDNSAQTAVDAQAQPVSKIELMGNQVTLKSGARIVAPAGNVQIAATGNPVKPGPTSENQNQTSNSQFVMESGSSIDVSGLNSAVLPMERNVVAVELRGTQLADSPLQRDGPLRGETVYIDVRRGTPLANVSGEIAKIERPLEERLATGGKVSIMSDGGVVTQENATINVSGGSIRYQDGFVNTTQLISQGKVYDIGSADPNRPYDGIYGTYKVVHKKWGVTENFNVFGAQQFARFESGYLEGKDAGTVTINARNLDMQGALRGDVTAGRYQRLPQSTDLTGFQRKFDQTPLGGELVLGALDYSGLNDYTLQSLTELNATGINRMRVYANGKITVPEQVNFALAPGGELTLSSVNVDVQGDITAHGGKVQIKALGGSTTLPDGSSARLGENGRIDVSGQWVNDSVAMNPGAAPHDPVFINGGKVTIEATGDLDLKAGSLIDASGGALLQRSGKLQYGKGGDIVITDSPSLANAAVGESSVLRLDGELRAYSFNKGGSLSLTGAGFRIGGNASDATGHTVYLDPGFFERGGFSAYKLKATHTGISIAQNTDVRLRALNRVLGPQFNLHASGTDLHQLGGLSFLPDYQQQPVSLGLSFVRASGVGNTARVELESGSSIHANPGTSIALSSDTSLIVDGTIAAPAGDIRLELIEPNANNKLTDSSLSRAIRLGPQGQLLAGAIYQPVPNDSGLRTGTVRDGGTVTIAATAGQQGYFISSPGSRIDVSGTTQTMDVFQGVNVTPTAVNGAAGTINLSAAEGMALSGDLIGTPGSGAGAAGGALSITLGTDISQNVAIALKTKPALVAPGLGETDLSKLNRKAEISPGKIQDGGFDSLTLHSKGLVANPNTLAQISLEGDIDLKMKGRLVLDTPALVSKGGQAKLAASYIALGPTSPTALPTPASGQGSMLLHGQHVDLIGTLAMSGFGPSGAGVATTAPIQIVSEGDVRLIGNDVQNRTDGLYAVGRLNSATDVDLRANQVYTTTATDYTLSVSGPDGRIRIQPGGASEAPLSAGSKLTLAAANIEQNGTLRAPFGQIDLAASNKLVLGSGSDTSVSGAGQLVPFGITQFGQDWLYPLGSYQGIYSVPPEKHISLKSPQVTLAPGSVVDVTGGGDLLAREQLPGPGGSIDILDAAHANGAFAIVPTRRDLYGSYDPFLSKDSPVKTGDTIYLAGGGPIAAGEYAMLPAGYALLPGAYLVTPLAKTASPIPGQAAPQFSGAAIVAGQRGTAGTGAHDSLWSAFLIENGTQVRSHAEYLESRADNFFAASAGRLNQDAGRLVIDAGTALILGGTLASNATGGRGSEVDIVAKNLAVVTSYTGVGDRVELIDTGLNRLHADSLLLGATRQQQGADVALNVRATDVTVESGTALAAPEVMLAANTQVTVTNGATITAAGNGRVGTSGSIQLAGDSAFARISSADQVRVQRSTSSTGANGTITVAAGAMLDASRSITLDASRDTVVDGDMRTNNGSLSLAASRVSLGDTQNVSGGLVLSSDRLKQLKARDLILNSRSTINLYGQVSLNLDHVALDAAGLAGYRNAGQSASISADSVSLSNRSGRSYVATTPPDGTGALNIAAREVTLGEGDFKVRGFSNTTVSATEQIIAKPETDTAVQLHVAGDLALQTSRLTASKGADVLIDTQDVTGGMAGKMALTTSLASVALAPVTDLGAKLELAATQIDHGTHIEMPSGIVTLHATGAGGVNIAADATIDVSGRDLHFADITVGSPGGQAALTADQGNVSIGALARIDVSGAPSGGDAGKLSISAPTGTVQLDPTAQLAAAAHPGSRAGSFALDARMLAGSFSTLNAALNTAGFNDGRQFRLRTGDVAIAADDTVMAHDLRIAADAGRIDVLGRIDASGSQAGQVALYAHDDVSLHGTSRIDAHATGTDEKGGSVTLASSAGRLDLQAGAEINVAGTNAAGAPADTGTVHLRAAREGTSGVSINPIAANITGAERVDIEANRIYTVSNDIIDGSLINSIQSDNNAFMSNASQVKNALSIATDARFHLLPGVEIQSPGDLTLNTNWDLLNWRQGGEAGVLTLKAAGNLNINQYLSDGVVSVTNDLLGTTRSTAATTADQINPGNWSYRLSAGADITGADPLAVKRGVGSVTVGSGAKVRTGTGHIEIAAGKDMLLADSSSAIYTVGKNRGTGGIPATADLPADLIKELLFNGDFLQKGGDIRIAVGGNIQGANGHQLINEWLPRVGGTISLPDSTVISMPASWAVNIDNFQQNIGALGGGNITVNAGGYVDNLSVVIPTTGQPVGGSGTAPSIAGGGDLHVATGGDIRGGVFYVGKGKAHLQAGGSITHAQGETVYPVLALGDGQYAVRARKNLTVEGIVNPTALPVSAVQGLSDFMAPSASFFFTYTPDSAARLEAISGNVVLRGNTNAMQTVSDTLRFDNSQGLSGDTTALSYLPGTLSARSLQGDMIIGNSFTLTPAPRGDLELLARGSIAPGSVTVNLLLSDADPALLPGILTPAMSLADADSRLALQGSNIHAASPVHQGDTQPVRVVAQTGDLGSLEGSRNQMTLSLSKQARLYAGQDVRNLTLQIEHADRSDISVVEAAGNVLFPTERDGGGNVVANRSGYEVAGPGQFYVIAGKDVDLGASNGIVSTGRTRNPALPEGGADITVMAGQSQAPAYDAFIERYLVKEDAYRDRLAQYMKGLGSSDTGVGAFRALPRAEQRKFILEVLFSELRESGVAAVVSKNYETGFTAIETLFPGAGYAGDVKSFLSQITTTDGGDINLVVPGGLVNAGVAGSTSISKKADLIGIVAARDGDINAFVHDDFMVNSSRVFALDGGDILIWSSTGNIDAGKGAKTALSIPPPKTTFDADGNAIVQFPPAISGSGIQGAVSTPGRKPGDTYLIAPVGVINAGDAGIGSAGNLTVAATAVLGADNIKVGGTSTGVPTDTGGLGAGLAGVGDIAATASKVAEDATRGLAQANEHQTFLGVEVIGFGE